MNIGVWKPSLIAAALLGGALAVYTGDPLTAGTSSAAVTSGGRPANALLRVQAQDITVNTLVVSHALTTFADDTMPASRTVTLNLAKANLRSALATTGAISAADLSAVGSSSPARDEVTRTLSALSSEVDVMISCERTKTGTCGTAQMILRQAQAGAAAGAAVADLNRAADVDQRFAAVAAGLVSAGPTGLGTATVRQQACLLVPLTRLPTVAPAVTSGP